MLTLEYFELLLLQFSALQMHFSPFEPCHWIVLLQVFVSSNPQDRTKTRLPSSAKNQISCKILRRRFFLKSYHHMAMYIIFEFRNNGNRSLQTHVLQKNKMLRHNTINSWSTCSSFTYEV